MKTTYKGSYGILIMSLVLFLTGCKVDTLDTVKGLEPVVSLVQVIDGTVKLTPNALVIYKSNLLLRKTFGLVHSGFIGNDGFTAGLQLVYDDIPEGFEPFTPEECFLTASATETAEISSLQVPAGEKQKAFYLNISKSVIDAHPGTSLAVKLRVDGLSTYSLNEKAREVTVVLNTADFSSLKTEITAAYIKNANFAREPGTTERFVNLADWKANDAVTKSRPTGAGFDANPGFMGIERWGSWDSPILNGKIYQTFTLPAGSYQIEVDMRKVAVDRDTYLAVAAGATIPDDEAIATALANVAITNDFNENLLSLTFSLAEQQEVSMGFLINIDQGVEKILQASAFRLYKLESLFD